MRRRDTERLVTPCTLGQTALLAGPVVEAHESPTIGIDANCAGHQSGRRRDRITRAVVLAVPQSREISPGLNCGLFARDASQSSPIDIRRAGIGKAKPVMDRRPAEGIDDASKAVTRNEFPHRFDRWPEIKRRILIALRAEVVFLPDQEDLHAEAWKVVEGRSLRHNPLPDDLHVIVARKRHRVLFDDHRASLSTRLDILHGPLEIINEKTLAATIGATTDAEGGRRAAELPAAGPLRLSKQCQAVFDFRMGWEREGPKRFLGKFEGLLQTDGYAAYDHVGGPGMVHAGCWAHARRKFFQALELNPKDQSAIGIVAQIDELFKVDRRAREQGPTPEARHAFRLVNSQPLLEEIRSRIEAARAAALPKSLLAKAANYTTSLWPRLNLFLQYPELELSNNWAENAIRPLALGRKNWIHIGSEEAGPRVAAIVSIIETCLVAQHSGSRLTWALSFRA